MKDLVPQENEKSDAFTRILRFYDRGDIVLTAAEEEILKRWNYCDKLMRQRRYKTDDILDKLVEIFSVSRYTAQNDIKQTYALFGTTRVLNKNYILSHHIEDIQLQIERAKFDKSLVPMLPKLYDALTKAVAALPDQITGEAAPTPNIYIGVAPGQDLGDKPSALPIDFEQAKELLRRRKAAAQNQVVEDIDHEDV